MTTTGSRSVDRSSLSSQTQQRDSSDFWVLGPRTHLELRSVIENAIRSSEGENDEIVEERLSELPQILFY
jgi:hypothetical protein